MQLFRSPKVDVHVVSSVQEVALVKINLHQSIGPSASARTRMDHFFDDELQSWSKLALVAVLQPQIMYRKYKNSSAVISLKEAGFLS